MRAPCKHPGCPTLVNGNAYCDQHVRPINHDVKAYRKRYDATTRRDSIDLSAAASFRSSKKWQRVRRVKLSMNPICEDPFGDHDKRGLTETAKQVHHIVGLNECAGDSRAYDLTNLMSVCFRCHARIETAVRKAATLTRGIV
jgi:5-methylcytosine-specific restriction endonuclease McrA